MALLVSYAKETLFAFAGDSPRKNSEPSLSPLNSMPALHWIGKDVMNNHHLELPELSFAWQAEGGVCFLLPLQHKVRLTFEDFKFRQPPNAIRTR